MVFGSEWMLDKVSAFLDKIEAQDLPAIVVYYLVCKYALDKQMCRGRDCGTCDGGRCADAPTLSLYAWRKTAELYKQYKESRNGRVWPEALREVEWEIDYTHDFARRCLDMTFEDALADSQKEWPEMPVRWFRVAWNRLKWLQSRENLWA